MLPKFKKTRMAGAMALVFSLTATSLSAGPLAQFQGFGTSIPTAAQATGFNNLVEVHHKSRRGARWCRNHPRRCHALRNGGGGNRDRFLRGHRGSKFRRHGFRRHNDGWWYPLAAFAFTAFLFDQHNNNQGHAGNHRPGRWNHIAPRNVARHDNWCDNRYRTYSYRTKTFQPYHGPRRLCNSPFDKL